MKKSILILSLLCCLVTITISAASPVTDRDTVPGTSRLRISVLTCAPGEELYSLFGHTALRIINNANGTDIIYNYGTFDFSDPDFYTKFVRGKLNYFLSEDNIYRFVYAYQMTGRSVIEQELLVNDSEKQAIVQAVAKNMEGDNRYYKYDFFYDNCTSRVRDLLVRHAGMEVDKKLTPDGTSFRDMLHEYLDRGGMGWIKLGIDIILAVPADKKVTIDESMFLPDYLMKGIDSAAVATHPVRSAKQILAAMPSREKGKNNTPLYILSLIAVIALILSFIKTAAAKKITHIIDRLLMLLTGCIGLLLLFLWFGTDHTACEGNYNLLWAIPVNIVPALLPSWKRSWLKKYFLSTAIVYGVLLAGWFWLPQQLNIALAPVVLLLLFTAARLSKKI